LEGLIYRGKIKIDWASLIIGSKFTVFALSYFVFEGNSPSTSPRGAYIWRGDLTEGFFALPAWGAYTWRGLFSEFYGKSPPVSLIVYTIHVSALYLSFSVLDCTLMMRKQGTDL